jgi:hypothetical protein
MLRKTLLVALLITTSLCSALSAAEPSTLETQLSEKPVEVTTQLHQLIREQNIKALTKMTAELKTLAQITRPAIQKNIKQLFTTTIDNLTAVDMAVLSDNYSVFELVQTTMVARILKYLEYTPIFTHALQLAHIKRCEVFGVDAEAALGENPPTIEITGEELAKLEAEDPRLQIFHMLYATTSEKCGIPFRLRFKKPDCVIQ